MKKLYYYIRQSLSLKLGLGVLLFSMLIFSASLGLLYNRSRQYVKQQTVERARAELRVVSQQVASLLSTVETAASSNKWLITDHLTPDSLLSLTRRIVALNRNVSGCSITMEPGTFPQYGRYFSAYSVRDGDSIITVREAPYEYFDKKWYKEPREKGAPCWVDPFDDYNEGTLSAKDIIASYCMPVYDDRQRFIGVITTDLSMPLLKKTVDVETRYRGGFFQLIGKDGHFYVHRDSSCVNKSVFDDTITNKQTDLIALGHEVTSGLTGARFVNIFGSPGLVCFQPIEGTDWRIALVCPERSFLHRYNNLTFLIIPLIVFGLLLILLFCHRIVRNALIPVRHLEVQAQRIADGYYDERIARTDRLDAVGRLQNSFSLMQSSLNQHISEIRRANADIAHRNEEMVRARQLAEESGRQKVAFIQDISHQVRTPLNIVMGFSQVLRDNFGELQPEEVRRIADMMRHNTLTLHRMIQMLYDSSDTGISEEKNSFIFEDVACNRIVRKCIKVTQGQFPDIRPINFVSELPDSYTINTSYTYFKRALRELLFNAAKFSDGEHISAQITGDGHVVRFIVTDTGPGIPEAYRDQMFEFFSKFNPLSEGLGLGLPLVRMHTNSLGGKLIYDTDYKGGCRFIIEMPAK